MIISTNSAVFRTILLLLAVPIISCSSRIEIIAYCKDGENSMKMGNACSFWHSKNHKTNNVFCQSIECGFENSQIILESKSLMPKVTIKLTNDKKCYTYENYFNHSFRIDITVDCKCRLPDYCLVDVKTIMENRGLWKSQEYGFDEQQKLQDVHCLSLEVNINVTEKEMVYLYERHISSYMKIEIFTPCNYRTKNACFIIISLTAALLFIVCHISMLFIRTQISEKEYSVRWICPISVFEDEHKLLNSGVEKVFDDSEN